MMATATTMVRASCLLLLSYNKKGLPAGDGGTLLVALSDGGCRVLTLCVCWYHREAGASSQVFFEKKGFLA